MTQITGINRVDMGVEGEDAGTPADAADDAAESVNADFVKSDFLHLVFDHLNHSRFLARMGGSGDQFHEETDDFIFQFQAALCNHLMGPIHIQCTPMG